MTVKMPEPMTAPMPSAVSDHGPRLFLSRCSDSSDSEISLSMDLHAKICFGRGTLPEVEKSVSGIQTESGRRGQVRCTFGSANTAQLAGTSRKNHSPLSSRSALTLSPRAGHQHIKAAFDGPMLNSLRQWLWCEVAGDVEHQLRRVGGEGIDGSVCCRHDRHVRRDLAVHRIERRHHRLALSIRP